MQRCDSNVYTLEQNEMRFVVVEISLKPAAASRAFSRVKERGREEERANERAL